MFRYRGDWAKLSRNGTNGSNFNAWRVRSGGSVNGNYVGDTNGARPVFYLASNQAYLGGNGSLDDPFMIQ